LPVATTERLDPGSIVEIRRRAGHFSWVEMRLFEALGGWGATVPELPVKLMLSTHSHHFAWHADLWRRRIGEFNGQRADEFVTPPNEQMREVVEIMTGVASSLSSIERLVGVYRVIVPHCIAAYTFQMKTTSAATDPSTLRVCKQVLADEVEDWREGELALQTLIANDVDVEVAGAHQRRLERLMVAAGGVAGPGTLGEV
jgi:hypothetical protein